MFSKIIILNIISNCLIHFTLSLTCYENGQCRDSNFIEALPVNEINDCILSCKENIDCNWSTYYSSSFSFCNLFSDCNILDTTDCSNCISSMKECDTIQCDIEGFCKVKRIK